MGKFVPFGAWESPISASEIAAGGTSLQALSASGDSVYLIESRPSEMGRQVLLRLTSNGDSSECTPSSFNTRTRVHEYGGGEYWVHGGVIFAVSFTDQRVYRIDDEESEPVAITPDPETTNSLRYANGTVSPDGSTVYCVQENHIDPDQILNQIVSFPSDGSVAPRVIFSGTDFVSSPKISPDGLTLTWLSWDHPNMPWDGTQLHMAQINSDGGLSNRKLIAGGSEESITQPTWSPNGVLHFISDRSGWWNLYFFENEEITRLVELDADFAGPDWQFGFSSYDFMADSSVICTYKDRDRDILIKVGREDSVPEKIQNDYSSISDVSVLNDVIYFIGSSPVVPAELVSISLAENTINTLRQSREATIDASFISEAEFIEFDTTESAKSFALFYPPKHAHSQGAPNEKPPLLVMSHGGPTSATSTSYNLAIQYWTSRGIAVVDVNYRGSSGFGRAYRNALRNQWGVFDTADCIAAARFLEQRGDVDGSRMAIRGGSAGGYTTLCALTFHDVFQAGASYYGVADAEILATETHKFESRYLDQLMGPYPAARDVYVSRSPIHYADQIRAAVIVFQGLEDQIVPPAQAELMVDGLIQNKLPHVYMTFRGEQHGFRQAANIIKTLESELSFYGQILGFSPPDISPIEIVNQSTV